MVAAAVHQRQLGGTRVPEDIRDALVLEEGEEDVAAERHAGIVLA
jgi:hypothetical protein